MLINKIVKGRKKELLVGIAIFILALFLRTYNLNAIPVFGDEAIYVRWAQVMRAEPSLRFLPLTDGKQPLFMWSVIPLQKVISDPLIAGRMVSVLAGLGTLVGVFVLTQLLFNSRKLSFFASLFYAVSPFSVFFDRMALVDSMLTFFGVWTFVFALITVKKLRLDSAMLAGFTLGGSLLTKSPAIFFAVLTPLSLILHKWPKGFKKKFTRVSVFIFLFSFTYLIALGLYNILRLGTNFHMIGIRNQDYVYPLSHILESPLDPLLPFLDRSLEYFWLMGPSALVFLFALGTFWGLKEKRRETLIILAWAILPILAVSAFSRTMTARYIYFTTPYLFILSALTISFLAQKVKGSVFVKILLFIFVLHALFINFQLLTNPQAANLPRSERSGYLEEWTAGYGIREVADYIRNQAKDLPAGRQVVVGTEGLFGTLPDALQAYLADTPEVTVIGVGQITRAVPTQLLDSKLAGNKTYFVVNSSRLPDGVGREGLKLLAEYKKAIRPNGTREVLLLFEVTNEAIEENN